MPRYVRKTAILAKIETVYGTDAAPAGASDALLVSNLSITPITTQAVDREVIRPYFGASEQLQGAAYVECSFDVELAGSGAAGTAPAWGKLLRACGMAETVTAGSRVEYSPITDAQESLTVNWHDDGVLHKLLGARGTAVLKLPLGGKPVISCSFQGLYGGVSAASNPAVTLTAWRAPVVPTDANTGDITLGGTYAAGAVTGGATYPSQGIELDVGNTVEFVPLLGSESVDITDRSASLSMALDLTAAQEVTLMGEVRSGALRAVSLQHGTTAGGIVLLHARNVQLIEPTKQDVSGRRLVGFGGRVLPVSGNDELVVCCK